MEKSKDTWTVLSSEYLHRAPWLTVRKDHVVLPNGNHIPSYYILEYPNWVNTIAITRDGQFVFIRQYRHGIQETSYELCAGVACEEEDGSPMVSAQRELLEETGYGNGVWKEFMQISPNPSTHTNITYCFLATDVEKISEQQLEDTENLTVHLLSLQEVKELLQQGSIRQALMAAPSGNTWRRELFNVITLIQTACGMCIRISIQNNRKLFSLDNGTFSAKRTRLTDEIVSLYGN